MPKISVIIPVYNTEKYLEKCLDSVCNQTLPDIEIICVNDCSTDKSLEILHNYAQKDKRIKVIELFENSGAAKARNIGIDIAKGEYIGFVDSDDFVDLDFYEKLYTKAVLSGADAVKGELWEINDMNKEPVVPYVYDLNSLIKKNKAYFYFTFTSAIYSKSFLDKYNIKFPEGLCHLEDPYFTIKAAIFYQKLEVIKGAKYYYDITQATRAKKKSQEDILDSLIKGIEKILNLINNSNITKQHYLIVSSFLFGQISESFNYIDIASENYDKICEYWKEFFIKVKYKNEILSSYYSNLKMLKLISHKNNVFRELQSKIKVTA